MSDEENRTEVQKTEVALPEPEFGPAMRALNPRWQRAVTALFLTNGNRAAALRMAGYSCTDKSIYPLASKIFADDRVRRAIQEEAAKLIDISSPEVLGTILGIMRDTGKRDIDRLRAAEMLWSRSNPVVTKHQIQVEHTLTNDDRDLEHYRALKRLGAPQQAFIDRFGVNGLARVQALVAADDAKQKKIESSAGIVDGEFEVIEVKDDE